MTGLSRSSAGTPRRSLYGLPGVMFAIALMVEPGCLIPQSIDALDLDAGPHPVPHFVVEAIPDYMRVPVLALYRQGAGDPAQSTPSGTCHCQLLLALPLVEEQDPTVTLQVRWFLDYDATKQPNPIVAPLSPSITLTGSFDNPVTQRKMDPYPFDADARGILADGLHVVEAVVADQAGFDDSATDLPFRTMKPGYEADVYRFFIQVTVTPDPKQQHCPGVNPTPPSERVNCTQ